MRVCLCVGKDFEFTLVGKSSVVGKRREEAGRQRSHGPLEAGVIIIMIRVMVIVVITMILSPRSQHFLYAHYVPGTVLGVSHELIVHLISTLICKVATIVPPLHPPPL